MTNEELKKIKASMDRAQKKWDSLSEAEKRKEAEDAKDTRLWEDWTDCAPVTIPKSRSTQK